MGYYLLLYLRLLVDFVGVVTVFVAVVSVGVVALCVYVLRFVKHLFDVCLMSMFCIVFQVVHMLIVLLCYLCKI